jgi:hypothetical protein
MTSFFKMPLSYSSRNINPTRNDCILSKQTDELRLREPDKANARSVETRLLVFLRIPANECDQRGELGQNIFQERQEIWMVFLP